MSNKKINGFSHLSSFSNSKIYTKIKDDTIDQIGKKNILSKKRFNRLKKNKRISLASLMKISKKLNIPENILEENIISLTSVKNTSKGIKNPKLPFNFHTKAGMRVLAGILGDGAISKDGNVRYHNQEPHLIKLFTESINTVFGEVDFKKYLREDNTYHLSFPKIIAIVLKSIGMGWGYKTELNPKIPNFVFSLEKKLKAVFVRQYSNDEGNVRLRDRRVQMKQTLETTLSKKEIKSNIEKYVPKCLIGLRKILLDLNIVSKISLSSYRIDGNRRKADWEISIYGKENLENFNRFVGFDVKYKKDLLEKCLASYKSPSAGRNSRLLYALQYAAKIEMENGLIDKYLLAKKTKRGIRKTCTYYLVDLKKRGLIEVVKKPRNSLGIPGVWKYKITKAGWDYLKSKKDLIFIEEVRKGI